MTTERILLQDLLDLLDPAIIAVLDEANFDKFAQFKSRTEEAFFNYGKLYIEEAYGCKVKAIFYEWMSFNIPSSSYTPDFACLLEGGGLVFVEVKATPKQQHYRISRLRMRITASLNPFFSFCMAHPVPKSQMTGWVIDRLPAERRLAQYLVYLTTIGANK